MANLERPPELSDPRFKDWIYQAWKKIIANGVATAATPSSGVLSVPGGGTGAVSLSGYIKGNGTNPLTGVAQIPYSDISDVPNNRVYGPNIDALDNTITTGIYSITGVGSSAVRTMTGTANRLTVTNGNGVSGNPTFDISTAYVGQATITTLGTITTGVWNAGNVTSPQVTVRNTGAGGANLVFEGSGATTPNKYIRAALGNLEFINSAYGAVIATLTDTGALSCGAVTSSGAVIGTSLSGGLPTGSRALNASNNANTAGYSEVAWLQVTNNAGGTNYSRLLIGQNAINNIFIEAADQSNVKGTLSLQVFGGATNTGGAFAAGGAITCTSTIACTAGTGTAAPVLIGTINVNTTAVGNVGAAATDLMTYSLPANSLSANGKGVRITAFGTYANNAATKTLKLMFGLAQLTTRDLTPSLGTGVWRITAELFRAGSNAQLFTALLHDFPSGASTSPVAYGGTAAITDTAAITIKCTGAATADNDIVQNGMFIEFIN